MNCFTKWIVFLQDPHVNETVALKQTQSQDCVCYLVMNNTCNIVLVITRHIYFTHWTTRNIAYHSSTTLPCGVKWLNSLFITLLLGHIVLYHLTLLMFSNLMFPNFNELSSLHSRVVRVLYYYTIQWVNWLID